MPKNTPADILKTQSMNAMIFPSVVIIGGEAGLEPAWDALRVTALSQPVQGRVYQFHHSPCVNRPVRGIEPLL